ncbi:MAG: CapA family protein [Candidatus Aenigmatarchaeota archaeon]
MARLKILLTGDVMLGRTVNRVLKLDNFSWVWGNTIKIFHEADLRLINLECVISSKGTPDPRSYFHFRSNPVAIEVLKKAKIDFASIANNHVLDFGEEALLEMLELLRKNKIAFSGAGENIDKACEPAILEKNDVKIAIFALSDHPPWWEALENRPGINFIPLNLEEKYLERIKKIIKNIREKVDFIIASCHVGPHYRSKPSKEFVNFAHTLLELGVDIYWGHSNHIPQGIEVLNNKVIIYDSGDFVDDYAVDKFEFFSNDQSFIFLLNLERKKIISLELVPVKIDSYKMQVNLAENIEKKIILENMKKLCEDLETKVRIRDEKIFILL